MSKTIFDIRDKLEDESNVSKEKWQKDGDVGALSDSCIIAWKLEAIDEIIETIPENALKMIEDVEKELKEHNEAVTQQDIKTTILVGNKRKLLEQKLAELKAMANAMLGFDISELKSLYLTGSHDYDEIHYVDPRVIIGKRNVWREPIKLDDITAYDLVMKIIEVSKDEE